MRISNYVWYRMEVAVNCKEIEVSIELNVLFLVKCYDNKMVKLPGGFSL